MDMRLLVAFVSVALLCVLLPLFAGAVDQRNKQRQAAFERGYLQQCVGTDKLYWKGECPND